MALESSPKHPPKTVEDRERVIVRFAGDSDAARATVGDDELDALLGAGNTWIVV